MLIYSERYKLVDVYIPDYGRIAPMSQRDRIAEIEDLTVKEFKAEIKNSIENLRKGIKPGNTIELLAATMNISLLGEELKLSFEQFLQLDFWEKTDSAE